LKIIMQESAATKLGTLAAGAIIEVPEEIGREWCKSGLAIETTSIEPPENAMLSRPIRRKAHGVNNKNTTNNRTSKPSRG